MKLSSRARHGVRLAVEISRMGNEGNPVRLSEIAKVTGLSRRFLEQLAIALKSQSIIRGFAGRKGGYVLARPAQEITVGQVLRAVIGPIQLAVCTEEADICMSGEFCECRLLWLLLKQRINQVLDEYTLADITDKNWVKSIREKISAIDPLQKKHTQIA